MGERCYQNGYQNGYQQVIELSARNRPGMAKHCHTTKEKCLDQLTWMAHNPGL
jgi:hypothetical protein